MIYDLLKKFIEHKERTSKSKSLFNNFQLTYMTHTYNLNS